MTVVLDEALLRHERLNFHPLENTRHHDIRREDFLAFLTRTPAIRRESCAVSGADPA